MGDEDVIYRVVFDAQARERLREAVAEVCASRAWVKAAWWYGSTAVGGTGRDVDIGLLADPVPSRRVEEQVVSDAIAARLGVDPALLDVRLLNGGDPPFLASVLSTGLRVYEADRRARVEFEVRAMSTWLDFRPAWERMRREALDRWSRG